jgi:hypothetical protein
MDRFLIGHAGKNAWKSGIRNSENRMEKGDIKMDDNGTRTDTREEPPVFDFNELVFHLPI